MEVAWLDDTPHARFWRRLLNGRVDEIVSDTKHLRSLRTDYTRVKDYQRRYKHIFEERGLNLFELIAKACGEVWDNEDEEKGGAAKKKCPIGGKGNYRCRQPGSPT